MKKSERRKLFDLSKCEECCVSVVDWEPCKHDIEEARKQGLIGPNEEIFAENPFYVVQVRNLTVTWDNLHDAQIAAASFRFALTQTGGIKLNDSSEIKDQDGELIEEWLVVLDENDALAWRPIER